MVQTNSPIPIEKDAAEYSKDEHSKWVRVQSQTYGEKAAAEYLGLSVRTLQKRRFERKLPPYLKISKSVKYLKKDLDAFLEQHRINPGEGA